MGMVLYIAVFVEVLQHHVAVNFTCLTFHKTSTHCGLQDLWQQIVYLAFMKLEEQQEGQSTFDLWYVTLLKCDLSPTKA